MSSHFNLPLTHALCDLHINGPTDRPIPLIWLSPDLQSVWVNIHHVSKERLIGIAVLCLCACKTWRHKQPERKLSLSQPKQADLVYNLWPCLKPTTPITSCLSGLLCPDWDGSVTPSSSVTFHQSSDQITLNCSWNLDPFLLNTFTSIIIKALKFDLLLVSYSSHVPFSGRMGKPIY